MSVTNTIQNQNLILETQELIVSAIRKDFGTKNIQIAAYELPVIEEYDPLGMAFYTYAILETEYISQELASNPETWKLWAQSRLDDRLQTPYIDTELPALGLILYVLAGKQKLPENSSKFISLVEEHFSDTKGIYHNFMSTVLAGLGIAVIDDKDPLFLRISKYIESNLLDHRQDIFNDPKNFVATYWWSRQTGNEELRNLIRNECVERFRRESYLARDICYIAYVLLEEIKSFPRSERKQIKGFIEKSLQFIRNYTIEKDSDLPREVSGEYGFDIALSDEYSQDLYGYPSKPRLSRILLSIGLLIEQRYIRQPYLFDGTEQWLSRGVGAFGYASFFAFLSFLVIQLWVFTNFGGNFKTDFQSQQNSLILLGVGKVLLSSFLIALGTALGLMAVLMLYHLLKDSQVRHLDALRKSWKLTTKIVLGELILAILVNLLTSIS